MPTITLTNGSEKHFDKPVTAFEVAEAIGPGLAKAALAAVVNDQLVDTAYLIEQNATLKIITDKDPEGLEIIRHSSAHLLAHAVKALFPSAQVTIGPVIEDGFYYDFAFERAFTPEDLEKIEAKMHELAKADFVVERCVLSRDEAISLFSEMGEDYKLQIINDIPEAEQLTAYRQDDFIDLCRGPHAPRTGLLKAFKLTKLAGAYWRGDSHNEMLQRIYGTAWANKKDLAAYLHRIEEAEKRDHRKLAQKMDLFHLQDIAPGMVFWHPNGWQLVMNIREHIRKATSASGYQEINTPEIVDVSLWEQSGHLAKFSDDIFLLQTESRDYVIKPMNCPCHVQIFKQGLKSYRDLPLRLAEFGSCHRNEPSGTLHGLMRVRGFVQDDGHIFCTESQISEELMAFIDQLHQVYADFGFTEVIHRLSTRPEVRVGEDDALWDKSEKLLQDALEAKQVKWELNPGEGAFYGPKIEFSMRDCLGREWQLGTMQIDYFTPARLGAHYIAEDGSKQTPVMLHRAMLGSIERFIGILLEHYAGWLPLWLAPQQLVVMGITDRQDDYVRKIVENLRNRGLRVILDLRNEKIGFKIREHTIARVPYQVVVGDREMADQTLSVRTAIDDRSTVMTQDQLLEHMQSAMTKPGGD